MNFSSAPVENKSDLLKGKGNVERSRELLEMIMNNCDGPNFKVTVNDSREFFGALAYVDKYNLFLTDCEERYTGSQAYTRNCGNILIPFKIIKLVEIKKGYFDSCYEELKKAQQA
ncbi:hypothetical protein PCYB_053270 [Plasmodium cynomolgi strain B]|uniref:LSM domain-containing protein n=1 Tax=Plasmodium cynomolgi (strain B) TaxID=1120755 RepID=K6UQS5_PLACD|nr:hypothetical protein PCYB_053270 [Plasmodium cynomolgi strain B]GAB65309.1 hypothetical protein PCYB_053270 [Plasmodium cynomolgi strain B]